MEIRNAVVDPKWPTWPVPDVTGWSHTRFAAWANAQTWTFAKSMPFMPHEYVVRQETPLFDEAIEYADQHGRAALWPTKKRHSLRSYFAIEGWVYWHMQPVGHTEAATILNRCRFDHDLDNAVSPANRVVWVEDLTDAERSALDAALTERR